MSSVPAKISKPQLRGLLDAQIRRSIIVSSVLGVISGIAFYYGVCAPRKQRYFNFYKNYDAEKECQRMVKAGLFESGR